MKTHHIKAAIVDDEEHCIEGLQSLIKKHTNNIEIIAKYNSAKEALLGIKKQELDLVFLDVEMPWMNGIELLTAFENVDFQIIFTTAHDQYAVKAFRLCAIDYLLKPIDKNNLLEAIKRVSSNKNRNMNEGIKYLNNNMTDNSKQHRIAIPTREGLDYILIEDILYCEADSNYTNITLKNNIKLLMSKPLKELASQLKGYNYLRIHNSYLINLNHMTKYVRGNAGYVIMVDGKNLNVSRSRKQNLLKRVGLN